MLMEFLIEIGHFFLIQSILKVVHVEFYIAHFVVYFIPYFDQYCKTSCLVFND